MAAVLYESMNGIARITIHRPEARNAIDNEVVQGMQAAWQRFAQDADDRVAVLHGAGEQAFTSGAALKDMPRDIWLAMPNLSVPCDKPIIAAAPERGNVINLMDALKASLGEAKPAAASKSKEPAAKKAATDAKR